MHRMRICCALLAISLAASSCAGAAASRPVVVAEPTAKEVEDGVAEVEFHGIPGLFFTFEAWRNVLIRFRLQQKDLQVALATETVRAEISEAEAKRLRDSQSRQQWAATYGPWLGFAGGLTAAAIVAGILGGVMNSMRAGGLSK